MTAPKVEVSAVKNFIRFFNLLLFKIHRKDQQDGAM